MTIKEEILKRVDEDFIVKKKPTVKKTLTVKSKIKLGYLLEELLLEAVDLENPANIIRAFERGQVPGVKKKVFLKTSFTEEQVFNSLEEIIKKVKARIPERDYNKYMFLLFKKGRNIENLDGMSSSELNELMDSMAAYFSHKNKKEAKEEESTREKFEEFENIKATDLEKNKEFEQWANEKFAGKAKAKDEDIEEIYSDKDGWNVFIPKTFAAAKKLACMADRKARWCTAANENMFRAYSKHDNPLYVIRNDKKDVMFQMDWGRGSYANFKDEKDKSATLEQVRKANVPADLLDSIKNNEGVSVKNIIDDSSSNLTFIKDTSPTPEDKLEGWTEHVFETIEEFIKEIERFEAPTIFKVGGGSSIESMFRKHTEENKEVERIVRITKDNEVNYYIKPGPNFMLRGKKLGKFILEVNGNTLNFKTPRNILDSNLPAVVKDVKLSNLEKTSEDDLDGWNEHVFGSINEFLKEIDKYEKASVLKDADISQILKDLNNPIQKIGRISKGRAIFYYVIPEGTVNFSYGRGTKTLERFALAVSGNKLVLKTPGAIINSNLPDSIKEKLFTKKVFVPSSERDNWRGSLENRSIPKEQLQKTSSVKEVLPGFFTGIETFADFVKTFSPTEVQISGIKTFMLSNKKFNFKDAILIFSRKKGGTVDYLVVNQRGFVTSIISTRMFNLFTKIGLSQEVQKYIFEKVKSELTQNERSIINKVLSSNQNTVLLKQFKNVGEKSAKSLFRTRSEEKPKEEDLEDVDVIAVKTARGVSIKFLKKEIQETTPFLHSVVPRTDLATPQQQKLISYHSLLKRIF